MKKLFFVMLLCNKMMYINFQYFIKPNYKKIHHTSSLQICCCFHPKGISNVSRVKKTPPERLNSLRFFFLFVMEKMVQIPGCHK